MIFPSVSFYLRDGPAATIRSPKETEAAPLLALQRLMSKETEFYGRTAKECEALTEYWQLNYISKMNQDPNGVMFACYIDERPVGLCKLWFETREREQHRAVLSVAVAKSFWGKGIGTELLKTAVDIARQRKGIIQVELQVVASNRRAIRLYRKLGFRRVARYPRAVRLSDDKLYDRFIMVRKL